MRVLVLMIMGVTAALAMSDQEWIEAVGCNPNKLPARAADEPLPRQEDAIWCLFALKFHNINETVDDLHERWTKFAQEALTTTLALGEIADRLHLPDAPAQTRIEAITELVYMSRSPALLAALDQDDDEPIDDEEDDDDDDILVAVTIEPVDDSSRTTSPGPRRLLDDDLILLADRMNAFKQYQGRADGWFQEYEAERTALLDRARTALQRFGAQVALPTLHAFGRLTPVQVRVAVRTRPGGELQITDEHVSHTKMLIEWTYDRSNLTSLEEGIEGMLQLLTVNYA